MRRPSSSISGSDASLSSELTYVGALSAQGGALLLGTAPCQYADVHWCGPCLWRPRFAYRLVGRLSRSRSSGSDEASLSGCSSAAWPAVSASGVSDGSPSTESSSSSVRFATPRLPIGQRMTVPAMRVYPARQLNFGYRPRRPHPGTTTCYRRTLSSQHGSCRRLRHQRWALDLQPHGQACRPNSHS